MVAGELDTKLALCSFNRDRGLGRCLHHSSCILRFSNAAIGNISKIFHTFLFNVTLSHRERLAKSHCGITLFDKL